jgi:beta-lactamase superfamily II metal-dependent hydrolase
VNPVDLNKLNPYPFTKEWKEKDKEAYGKVVLKEIFSFDDGTKVKCKLEISLLNRSMLNHDSEVASGKAEGKILPYFYDFSYEGCLERDFLYDLFKPLWCPCCPFYEDRPFFCEKCPCPSYKNYPLPMLRKFRILDNERDKSEIYEDKTTLLHGELLFSASPIQKRGVALKILDVSVRDLFETSEKIRANFDCRSFILNTDGRKILEKTISDSLPYITDDLPPKINIYNVWQGNNVFVEYAVKKGFFFDIGMTKERNDSESVAGALREMGGKIPNIVFLSHWDLDHILGITQADDSIYNCPWVAPNFYDVYHKTSLSAERLCAFLFYKNVTVHLIDESFDGRTILSIGSKFTLYKGMPCSYKSRKAWNDYGLILKLHYDEAMLLTGDCEYEAMPGEIFDMPYQYILAPHHGARMDIFRLQDVPRHMNPKAYISVGHLYGHPSDSHVGELRGRGYIVLNTRDLRHPVIKYEVTL